MKHRRIHRYLAGVPMVAAAVTLAMLLDGLTTLVSDLGILGLTTALLSLTCQVCVQQLQGSSFLTSLNQTPTVAGRPPGLAQPAAVRSCRLTKPDRSSRRITLASSSGNRSGVQAKAGTPRPAQAAASWWS